MKIYLFLIFVFWRTSLIYGSSLNKTGACDPRQFYDDVTNQSDAYWQCRPKSSRWNGIGEWEIVKCPSGLRFSKRLQRCESAATVRRQSICRPGFSSGGCVQGCGASNLNAYAGGQCNWLTAPLMQNGFSNAGFLQCAPGVSGSCGNWQQMPCAAGTVFNQQMQVCTTSALQGTCGMNSRAVCPCGSNNACPTGCSCNQGTCCQRQISTAIQQPLCGGGMRASGQCFSSNQCGTGFSCQSGGCCPQQRPTYMPTCASGVQAISSCLGTGQAMCGSGYQCQSGGCCPSSCPNGSPSAGSCLNSNQCPLGYTCMGGMCCRANLPTCPSGNQAYGRCAGPGSCPTNQYCYQQGCCSIPRCTGGQLAVQACSAGATCPSGTNCMNNACCPMALPTCPGGNACAGPCSTPSSCGSGHYCFVDDRNRQGCCPVQRCPTGAQAIASCYGSGTSCPSGYSCMNNACCQQQQRVCPGGGVGMGACYGNGLAGCQRGYACQNSMCCPVPSCPGGSPALQMCSGVSQCPRGSSCTNSVCCQSQQPMCPGGQPSYGSCSGGCGTGMQCINGGCCRSSQCANGQMALQSCSGIGQSSCPLGYSCSGGGCCRMSACGNGQLPVQACLGSASTCPLGYQCQGGGCCRSYQPQPIISSCPNGQPSVQSCGVGGGCPGGYNCYQGQCCGQRISTCPTGQQPTQFCGGIGGCPSGFQCNNGGCCPNVQAVQRNVCQMSVQQPICFCAAYNNRCPVSTSCYRGTCCAGQTSPLYNTMRPGDRCSVSRQCPGSFSSCFNGYCVCTGGARSNGVSCIGVRRAERRFEPGKSCGQFGADCNIYAQQPGKRSLKGVRRKPQQIMAELGIERQTEPIFWYTFSSPEHFCNSSVDCTPDMTCIESKCYPYLVLGDAGCRRDEQCSRTTEGAACVKDEIRNTSLCLCKPKLFLYDHQCWEECPIGTKAQGDICVPGRVEKVPKEEKPNLKEFAHRILDLLSSS